MRSDTELLSSLTRIRRAAAATEDGRRCMVAPSPQLRAELLRQLEQFRGRPGAVGIPFLRIGQPQSPGFDDGVIYPPEHYPVGTPMSVIRSAAADRAPLRGVIRVIVVLVDFSDQAMGQPATHFRDLFFSTGVIPTRSVREYYADVTNGLIDIQGDVVGPFRMPQTMATYAHGASGIGPGLPNARTMARDAAQAADPTVLFNPFDNDGDGFVDAFIVIHAGPGAEVTGDSGHLWSHKWVLDGGALSVDSTKIYAYLTVPEDSRIGVCCHELGHLLFGFPDLYDTDGTSEGVGNWCLMGAGSWGGGGDTPCHPSAWCKANQGWATVQSPTTNATLNIADVKDSHLIYRLWKDGTSGSEYFLMENRQQQGFDASLPSGGLLIWHVDESVAGNTNENHYKVAFMQADGQRDLEAARNRGDAGDPYPGSTNNIGFDSTSNPNSKSYGGADTCVAVTNISPPGPVMSANVQVRCSIKIREKNWLKDIMEKNYIRDKQLFDKGLIEKPTDGKPGEGGVLGTGGAAGGGAPAQGLGEPITGGHGIGGGTEGKGGTPTPLGISEALSRIESRLSALESALGQGSRPGAPAPGGGGVRATGQAEPFIPAGLRPDLSEGALRGEEDYPGARQQPVRLSSAQAKRQYDTKPPEA